MVSEEEDPLGLIGQTVAEKYVVENLVGVGGFAVVYRACHTIWKQPVAIKFFSELSNAPRAQREQLRQAFINEGALLTELSSQTAGIVQARDVGSMTTPDGRWVPYMVLEWLEGQSLEEVLEAEDEAGPRSGWSLEQMLAILSPVCGALDVAHQRGIAHRDIKPANLFVLGDNARSQQVTVKVLDFGVAKILADDTQLQAAMAKTGTEITSFTPQYGAPEQFSRNYGATGPWTDVFALALVAVELLLGRPALDGGDLIQLAYSSGNAQARPTPRSLGLEVPESVEEVFQSALAVAPQARYPRAGLFLRALENAIRLAPNSVGPLALDKTALGAPPASAASTTTRAPLTTSAPGPSKQGSGRGLVLGLVGLLGLGAVATGVYFSTREKPTPPAASVSASAPVPAASSSAERPLSCPDQMVLIRAGEFYMGSDADDALDNQKPAHNVSLSSYCIDLYEVTRAQYLACSERGACPRASTTAFWPKISERDKRAYSPLCNVDHPERSNHPINCVRWRDAKAYCTKNDKRLPTEAEWEYATRGPDGRVYPWGDSEPTAKHLNACDADCKKWANQAKVEVATLFETSDGFAATSPVGSFPAGRSRFGPHDVVGNVWEWVQDFDGKYGDAEQKNPKGPASGEKRVIRGGAWNGGYAAWLRPAFRYANDPSVRSPAIGFRCAADPKR